LRLNDFFPRIDRGKLIASLLTGLMLTVSGGITIADPLEDGVAAYERGDFATALRLFQSLAEQGDASAQSNLGVLYEKGQGTARDYREALKWYRQAAQQGYADAQFNLGECVSKKKPSTCWRTRFDRLNGASLYGEASGE
jgi:TPR repeat protein